MGTVVVKTCPKMNQRVPTPNPRRAVGHDHVRTPYGWNQIPRDPGDHIRWVAPYGAATVGGRVPTLANFFAKHRLPGGQSFQPTLLDCRSTPASTLTAKRLGDLSHASRCDLGRLDDSSPGSDHGRTRRRRGGVSCSDSTDSRQEDKLLTAQRRFVCRQGHAIGGGFEYTTYGT